MLPATLAEFVPLSPSAQWAIISILSVVLTVVLIWSNVRRRPPLDTELVKLQVAIEALNKSVGELTETQRAHASHGSEIEKLQEEVHLLRSYREEDLRSQREYTRMSGERVFKRIDELDLAVNRNFQSVERALGQLEGQIKSLTTR